MFNFIINKNEMDGGFMNRECTFENGVVIVKDECGNERKVDCSDNLEDILVQENIVETIKNVINALEHSSHSFSKYRLRDIFCIPGPVIETILVPSIAMYLTDPLNKSAIEGMIYTKFGLMKIEKFLAIFIAVFLPVGLHMSKKWYKEYNENVKCENGIQLLLEYLRDILVVQSGKLDTLLESSVPTNIDGCKSYSINNDEVLENLHEDICLYYDIGYNAKEYYRYYLANGKLPEELEQEYDKEKIKLVEELFQKRGKSLVKKGKSRLHK